MKGARGLVSDDKKGHFRDIGGHSRSNLQKMSYWVETWYVDYYKDMMMKMLKVISKSSEVKSIKCLEVCVFGCVRENKTNRFLCA